MKSPTHTSGHILDLVITRNDDAPPTLPTPGLLLSDHFCLTCSLDFSNQPQEKKVITFRKLKAINMDVFKHDVKESLSNIEETQDPDCLIEHYNKALRSVLDNHAPIQTKTVLVKPKLPWYDDDVQTSKQARRQSERRYHKCPTP